MSGPLRPHGLQHTRLPCPSPFPEVCPSSHPLHQWWHPAISSSDVLISFCPQSFPASRDFSNESAVRIRWPKYWSFGFSISPSSEHSGLISLKIDRFDPLAVQGTQESSPAPPFKSINSLTLCLLYSPALTAIRDHWEAECFSTHCLGLS